MAHRSHFTSWGLQAVGAAVGDWIATAKCICATLLFFLVCSSPRPTHHPSPHLPHHFTLFLSPFTFFKCLLSSKKILYQTTLVRMMSGKTKTHLHPSSLEMSPLTPTVSSKVLAPCISQHLLLVFLILLVFHRTPSPISLLMSFCATACSQDM